MSRRLLVVATGNRHKLAELDAMLRGAVEVAPASAFGEPPTIEETGERFVANAVLKAEGIAVWLRGRDVPGDACVLADDSGISIDALAGAPGVISARWAGEPSDDAANNRKLVAELRARGLEASAAHYTCVLALVRVDGRRLPGGEALECFEGRWDVEVRTAARGAGGFGYDPHAWLDGGACTVAELGADDKAARSHRGIALRRLLEWWQVHGL
ncbi:MAG: non-canonical purine NTP pyrophosphatase [Deltaproteobacteria bacterium]|nr:non-canonical purine NTP pyrophosphatase [Deltaproteobacteria bacterium]MBK8236411.1 non-canonical purine NTP pyrophosphatase [Deltaproteobacteria bacterium]MBK8717971.1 non-canonical purine NTP pyrophosphatase [Deltaproteobacteria bacterium]MBP7288367.1 non-canonical purine NTP pyrophosphatase [Nannocystaceae bacterium]